MTAVLVAVAVAAVTWAVLHLIQRHGPVDPIWDPEGEE